MIQGRIVGFMYATVERDLPIYLHEEFAVIREWWVEPAFRGRGAGKSLIARAAADFAEAGVAQLRARSAAGDEALRAVLQHCGFRMGSCELVMELNPGR